MTTNLSSDDSVSPSPKEADVYRSSHGTLRVVSRPSQDTNEDRLSQTSSKDLFVSQGLWQRSKEACGDGQAVTSTQMSSEIDHIGCSPSLLEEETVGRRKPTEMESEAERTEQMCSRHGKKMRSILRECSEELDGEAVQAECTPTSTKSTPSLLAHSETSASPHRHSLTTNTSASSHQDSSSTNISLSYMQEVSSLEKHVTPSPSSSSLKPISKQHAWRINAGDATEQVVFKGRDVKMSLESQSFLMQSRLLQPQVCLYRLSMEEGTRDPCGDGSEEQQESEGIKYAFFDANALYSDTYSESDSTDSDDPDYNPNGR